MNSEVFLKLPIETKREIESLHTTDDLTTKIKLEINNLVWMYAHPKTTLEDAEEMASDFWLKLMQNRNGENEE